MTPGQYPLQLYRGDSYRWGFVLWADVEKTLPVDLTDATAKAEIRDRTAGPKIIAMTCEITLPNTITAFLDADLSKTLPPYGVWDLQLTFVSGEVSTILSGTVVVAADVTDSGTPSVVVPVPTVSLVSTPSILPFTERLGRIG